MAIRRALALLPEAIRRGLYHKRFSSPFEFAFKVVGVKGDVVRRVLRLHDQIGHMPELWNLLATGEEGWAKLEIVSGVARPETAAWWAEQVRKCSTAELRELVRRLVGQQQVFASVEAPEIALATAPAAAVSEEASAVAPVDHPRVRSRPPTSGRRGSPSRQCPGALCSAPQAAA